MRKFTIDEVKNILLKLNLQLIDDKYINCKQKITVKDQDGYLYLSTFADIQVGRNKISKYNPYTIQNIFLWCKLNNKQFQLISTSYKNAKTKLLWKCLKNNCNEIFEMTWTDISQGHGCSYCSSQQLGISNCLANKNPNLAKEWHSIKNGNLTPYDVFSSSRKKVWWKCSENSEHEWIARIDQRSAGRNCPMCSESKGQKRIREYLKINKLKFEVEYTQFKDLVSLLGNPLRFDFAVFSEKFILIEYDGGQHYNQVIGWQTKKDFETIQIHDKLKNKYCIDNSIHLLRIPYTKFDNIELILKDVFLNKNINNKFFVK